jgi:ABC-type multidrug transport system ATPase subunit
MVIIANGKSIVQGNVSELLNEQDLIVSFEVDQPQKAKQVISDKLSPSVIGNIVNNKLQLNVAYQLIPQINQWLSENEVKVFGIDSKRKLEDYFLKLLSN